MIARWIEIWLAWLDQFAHLVAPTTRNCIFCGTPLVRYESKHSQGHPTFRCDKCHAGTEVEGN